MVRASNYYLCGAICTFVSLMTKILQGDVQVCYDFLILAIVFGIIADFIKRTNNKTE